jgi:hypothetical protein
MKKTQQDIEASPLLGHDKKRGSSIMNTKQFRWWKAWVLSANPGEAGVGDLVEAVGSGGTSTVKVTHVVPFVTKQGKEKVHLFVETVNVA